MKKKKRTRRRTTTTTKYRVNRNRFSPQKLYPKNYILFVNTINERVTTRKLRTKFLVLFQGGNRQEKRKGKKKSNVSQRNVMITVNTLYNLSMDKREKLSGVC